jgi:hypothetical protein
VRQDRCEGYTDDWAAVAAELQSQTSSQTMQRPAPRSQTPGSRRIGALVGQQDSQNESLGTDVSLDFGQASAARLPSFLESDPQSPDGSREVDRELTLDRTTPSQCLSLSLDEFELARQGTSASDGEGA